MNEVAKTSPVKRTAQRNFAAGIALALRSHRAPLRLGRRLRNRLHDCHLRAVTARRASDEQGREAVREELTDDKLDQIGDLIAQSVERFREMLRLAEALDLEQVDVDDFLEFRAEIGVLYDDAAKTAADIVASLSGITSAQDRMLQYLLHRVGEPVAGPALGGVSCIWEWARRKRELNVEHGWSLDYVDHKYVLSSPNPDVGSSAQWQRLHRIRRRRGGTSGQERILMLLTEAYPEAVSRDDLDYVAFPIRSRDRRKRNLQEAGWRISSYEDDDSLPNGYYRLDSLEKGPPRAREYIKLRQEILDAAQKTCQQCGARSAEGRRVHLQVHHKRFLQFGGNDEPDNLEVLCRHCHAGRHAVAESAVDDELLNPAADPLITSGA